MLTLQLTEFLILTAQQYGCETGQGEEQCVGFKWRQY